MAGLLTGIEKVYVEKFRQKTSSPKFQVCNTALISSRLFDDFKTISENPVKWGRIAESAIGADRKSVVQGKSVDLGGRRIIKKKKKT